MKITGIQILLIGIIYSCAPAIVVNSDYDKQANFTSYQTFAFGEISDPFDPGFPMFDNELNRQRVKQAITDRMLRQGFKMSENNPDLLVDFHIVIKDKTSVDTYHTQDDGFWRPYEVDVFDYTEGTLVIHLVDEASRKLVWQGSAVSVLGNNSKNAEERIMKAVDGIFDTYPHLP